MWALGGGPVQGEGAAGKIAAAVVHLRLVVHLQSALLQRIAQRRFQAQALVGLAVEVAREELEIVAPAVLGRVHRHIRMLEQLLRVLADKGATRRWLEQQRQFAKFDAGDVED